PARLTRSPARPGSPWRECRHDPAIRFLDKRRAFQTQPGAVRHNTRRMMMPDDLNAIPRFRRAVAMVKIEIVRLPGFHHLDFGAERSIVVAGDDDDLAAQRQVAQKS